MPFKPTGHGHIFESSGTWHTRFYVNVRGIQVQKSQRLCPKDATHPSKESVEQLAAEVVKAAQGQAKLQNEAFTMGKCPTCGRFTKSHGVATSTGGN